MNVENIKTDKDADDFVVSHYFSKKGAAIRIGDCNEPQYGFYYEKEVRSFLDSLNWHTWIKKDFNNDRKPDLVYCGCVDDGFKVLAFISNSGCDYLVTELSATAEFNHPHYIKNTTDEKSLIIEKYNPDDPSWDSSTSYRNMITADTLIFWSGAFVDKDTKEMQNQIDTIHFNYDVFLARIRNNLTVVNNGNMRFEKMARLNDTSSQMGIFVYEKKFSKDSTDGFFHLVNSLPLAKLDSFYNAPYFDGFHWHLIFKNKSKIIKDIFDHMGVAPYSIRLLYEFAMRRFKDPDWKLIEIKENW